MAVDLLTKGGISSGLCELLHAVPPAQRDELLTHIETPQAHQRLLAWYMGRPVQQLVQLRESHGSLVEIAAAEVMPPGVARQLLGGSE